MGIEEKVEELKRRVELMRRCYFKGYGNAVFSIYCNSEAYLEGNMKDKAKALIIDGLNRIEAHYGTLPFEHMNSNSDFAPLFVIRDLLPRFSRRVHEFLENPDKDKVHDISADRTVMITVGELYRRSFKGRIDELRAIPGYENFRVIVIDHKGNQFGM